MQSIRQNDLPYALPDFRNLGVISRILLSVNALALLFALARSREIGEFAAKVTEIAGLLRKVQHGLLDQAEKHADTVMPGFTHLQVAQPVVFGHHLLAYFEMLERDRARLAD